MNVEDRTNYIKKSNFCYMCLAPGHGKQDCKNKSKCYICEKTGHHPLLCLEEKKDAKVEVLTCAAEKREETYLKVSQCAVLFRNPQTRRSKYVNVMWDSGATCNLITNRLARELGYVGKSRNLHITTMSEHMSKKEPKPTPSQEFNIEILDNDGNVHRIKAFGLEQVQNKRVPIDKSVIKKYAQKYKIPELDIGNAKGPVEMIIGIGHDNLAPKPIEIIQEFCISVHTS